MKNAWKIAVPVGALAAIAIAVIVFHSDSRTVEKTRDYFFHPSSIGTLQYISLRNCWSQDYVEPGDGTFFSAFYGERDTGRFNGGWYYRFSFQLPEELVEGATYDLRPVSLAGRSDFDEERQQSRLLDGEFTAMRFGNPNSYNMTDSDEESVGTVHIESIQANKVTVKVEISARLENELSLEIHDTYAFSRKAP